MKVWKYIENHYETEYLKRVYINGDGGDWIKEGCSMIAKSHFVLDKYHLMNRINTATTHLLDSAEDAKAMIYEAINNKDRSRLRKVFREIRVITENEKTVVEGRFEGVITNLMRRYQEHAQDSRAREKIEKVLIQKRCSACDGKR